MDSLTQEFTSKWKNIISVPAPRELEFRLWNGDQKTKLSLSDFHRIVDTLKKKVNRSELQLQLTTECFLDITTRHEKTNLNIVPRLTITGQRDIQKYCKTNNLDDIRVVVISKDKSWKPVTQPEFHYRYQVSHEKPHGSDDPITQEMRTIAERQNIEKYFIYKNRMSILDQINQVRYDLTVCRSGFAHVFSDMLKNDRESYQVELEYVGDYPTEEPMIGETIARLVKCLHELICIYQDTNVLVSVKETKQTIQNYLSVAFNGLPKPDYVEFPHKAFIGMNVVGFEHQHIKSVSQYALTHSESILERLYNYVVTLKADGSRRLLLIDDKGYIHLVSNKIKIHHTGYQTTNKNYYNSILDGELISNKQILGELRESREINMFYVFDCFILGGTEMRTMLLVEDSKDQLRGKEKNRLNGVRNVVNMFKEETVSLDHRIADLILVAKEYRSIWEGDRPKLSICRSLMESEHDFAVDGLVFTPNYLFHDETLNQEVAYPIMGPDRKTEWNQLLKWKPLEQLSVDFKVEITSQVKLLHQRDHPIPHKVVNLRVARGRDLILFDPHIGNDKNVHQTLIEIHEGGRLQAKSGEQITNGNIVEFVYDNGHWIPVRLRFDKNRPNGFMVARNTWKMIVSPIGLEIISGEKKIESKYYEDIPSEFSNLVSGMKSFHNDVKTKLLISGIIMLDQQRHSRNESLTLSLFDVGTGRAGDLHKWKSIVRERRNRQTRDGMKKVWEVTRNTDRVQNHNHNPIKYVLGIDNNSENLMNSADNARSRTERMDYSDLSTTYLVADATTPFTIENETLPVETRTALASISQHSFDLLTCFFTLHYFCKSEKALDTFFENAKRYLRRGGVMLLTDLDGSLIYRELQDNGGIIRGTKKDHDIWVVQRGYSPQDTFDTVGQAINVYNVSINRNPIQEYLVNFEHLVEVANKHGFRVPQDIPRLRSADKMFSTYQSEQFKLSSAEKTYSDMHRSLILIKEI